MARTEDLRSENRARIREYLYTEPQITLAQLEKKTGLSHRLVVAALREMAETGEVKAEKHGTGVGRKTYLYSVDPDHMHLCGVLVIQNESTMTYRMMEIDLSGRVCSVQETEWDAYTEETFMYALDSFLGKCSRPRRIIIASPGICENGIVSNPGRYVNDIGAWIRKKYDMPVIIENDVNTAAIGFAQTIPEAAHTAFLYQADRTRFGCGIVIHGRLYNGFSHSAGELRWLPFMDDTGGRSAAELLALQIRSVAAVLDPEVIGWYSRIVPADSAQFEMPMPERNRPRIIAAEDMETAAVRGIYSIGIDSIVHSHGGK